MYRTIHGSRLYGLEHEGSDWDWYIVFGGKVKPKHEKYGNQDVFALGFDSWVEHLDKGVPQAFEALYSPVADVYGWNAKMLQSYYRPNIAAVTRTYQRTIKSFSMGDLKQRRHAKRLEINLRTMYEKGRFNPRLSASEMLIVMEIL